MKYLSNYIEEPQTAAFAKHGAFFAFSDKQLSESRKEGVEYVSMGMGLICPKINAKELDEDLRKILIEGIAQDVKENGIDNIIERELSNHEAWYTGNLDDTLEALSCYGELIVPEMVAAVYRNNIHKHLDD